MRNSGVLLFVTIALAAAAAQQPKPTAAELSRAETPGKAIMRTFEFQESGQPRCAPSRTR